MIKSKKSFRLVTAFILSLVLVVTMVPTTAFAADDSKTINLVVKNVNFDKEYINATGKAIEPDWTGTMNYKLKVGSGKNVAEVISDKFTSNVAMFSGYVINFFGFDGGVNIDTKNDYDLSGWMYSYNGSEPAKSMDAISDYGVGGTFKNQIKDGDTFVFGYTLDGAEIDEPYIDVPSNVKAARASYNSNKITWQSAGNKNGQWTKNITDYVVSRSTSKTGTYTPITTVSSIEKNMTYTDKSLKTGKTYYYKVKMVKGKNQSEYSELTSAKPTLSKPTIKVAKTGKKSLKITWKKVAGAKQYRIYRATSKNGKYKKIKTVSSSKLKYTNSKLKKGKKYYYKVRAAVKVDGKYTYSPYSTIKSKKR